MARTLLDAQKFFENGYGYSTTGGIGLSTNASGQRLIDCSGLVYQMARAAGYNVPRFGTGDLLDANGNIKPGASRFYQPVDKTDLQPGDILVFAPDGHTSGHVGVYRQGEVDSTRFTGDFFGAQNTGGIKVELVEGRSYWNTRTVLGVIRPRADRYDPALDQTGHNEVQLTPTAINSVTLAKQVTHLTDREFEVFKEAVASIDNAATVTTGMIDAYNGAMSSATQLSNLSQGLGGAASIAGLALALENGDPVGIAASTLSTLAAFQIIPVWGQIAAIALTVLDALLGEDEPPETLGHALAGYDEDGRLVALADPAQENRNDGAASAVNLLQNLLDGIGNTLPEGYALVPQRLPEIGYHSQYRTQYLVENPDGTYRHFDSNQSDQIGQGYLDRLLAAQALVPEYEARTIQARIEHGDADAWKVDASGGHPQISEDGQRQTLSALTLTLPGLTTHPNLPPEGEGANGQVWFDSDGDGILVGAWESRYHKNDARHTCQNRRHKFPECKVFPTARVVFLPYRTHVLAGNITTLSS